MLTHSTSIAQKCVCSLFGKDSMYKTFAHNVHYPKSQVCSQRMPNLYGDSRFTHVGKCQDLLSTSAKYTQPIETWSLANMCCSPMDDMLQSGLSSRQARLQHCPPTSLGLVFTASYPSCFQADLYSGLSSSRSHG